MRDRVSGLVLAAGEGRRFGDSNKLLADLDGRPLLDYALEAMADADLAAVACVVGVDADLVLDGIDLRGATPLICEDPERGQSASLRAGLKALAESDAVVVCLGDQPLISAQAIDRVVAGRVPGTLGARGTYAGIPGHPVVLERALFDALKDARGDRGARDLLDEASTAFVPCDGLGSPRDVDTPADLIAVARELDELRPFRAAKRRW